MTSHTWENGKNEESHQDPTLSEALMGEMSDVSRVLFPADVNSATAAVQSAYGKHGQIWTLVVPKRPLRVRFTGDDAQRLVRDGGLALKRPPTQPCYLSPWARTSLRRQFERQSASINAASRLR